MPKPTDEKLMETESYIRWDETDAPAVLWTASAKVRKEWESYSIKMRPMAGGGWQGEAPKDRITYKTLRTVKS